MTALTSSSSKPVGTDFSIRGRGEDGRCMPSLWKEAKTIVLHKKKR